MSAENERKKDAQDRMECDGSYYVQARSAALEAARSLFEDPTAEAFYYAVRTHTECGQLAESYGRAKEIYYAVTRLHRYPNLSPLDTEGD